jgi:hypothetical protein
MISEDQFLATLPAEFPYRRKFYPSPQELFRHLQNDDISKRIVYAFYHFRGRIISEPKLWDNLFRGKHVFVIADTTKADELSDLYLEHLRLLTHRNNSRPVLDYYTDPLLRQEFAREHLKRYPSGSINAEDLRDSLYYLTYESRQFRPSWGRGIIQLLFPPESRRPLNTLKMLDMSAGWGDRLITALSLGCDYTGYDPNINLKEGHDAMIRDFGDPAKYKITYEAFEKADVPENTFDFLLSSPPFFDVEIYPGGDQSIKNYPTLDLWFRKFLFVALDKAWKALKINGYLAIHLSELYEYVSADGQKMPLRLIDPLNLYIEEYLPLSSWVGCIGLTSQKFAPPPRGISASKNAKCWPVWVWQKVANNPRRWKSSISRNLRMFVSPNTLFEKKLDEGVLPLKESPNLWANAMVDEQKGITNYLLACYQKNLPLVAYFRSVEPNLIKSDKFGNSDDSYYFA